jgi:hypothetical protein
MSSQEPKYVAIKIPGTDAHMSITWLGKFKTEDELKEIHKDLNNCLTLKEEDSKTQMHIEFLDTWKILGKPEDIKRGKGVEARIVKVHPQELESNLIKFHKKWYHHEDGEAEERKLRPQFL